MKKIILASLMALFVGVACAQKKEEGVKFEEGTLKTILEKAGKEKKLVFVDCYTTWCPPCKALAASVFPSKIAGDYMNKTFINAKFDMEDGEGLDIRKKYKVTGFPTLLFLDSEGNEVTRMVGGGSDPEAFIQRVKETVAKIEKAE